MKSVHRLEKLTEFDAILYELKAIWDDLQSWFGFCIIEEQASYNYESRDSRGTIVKSLLCRPPGSVALQNNTSCARNY